jgi:hypothetical protein
MTDRTWTATIDIEQFGGIATLDASVSEYDLLRDQTNVAVREAAMFLDDDSTIRVNIFKRTHARGIEHDRSFSVFRDRRGVVRYY